jgi:hypothetical protein
MMWTGSSILLPLVALSAESLKILDIVASGSLDWLDVVHLQLDRMVTGRARSTFCTVVVVALQYGPPILQGNGSADRLAVVSSKQLSS